MQTMTMTMTMTDPSDVPPHDRPPTPRPMRVLLVDDHALVRGGYARLLAFESDIRVAGDCQSADEAQAWLEREHGEVEVVLLDLSMPGRSGLDLLQRISRQWPAVAVLVCTMHDTPTMLQRAVDLGARGVVTKSCDPAFLVEAVRRVARGEWVCSPDVEQRRAPSAAAVPHNELSPREFQVLLMLARGDTVESIAQALSLSTKRVANLQTQVRGKLGVQSAAELVHYALIHGLLPGPGSPI